MSKQNEILIRRKQKVYVPVLAVVTGDETTSFKDVYTCMANLYNLGYAFDQDLITELLRMSRKDAILLMEEIESICKQLKGDDVEYHPMYPDFPKQIMEMEDEEWISNAIAHYLSGGTYMPVTDLPKVKRVASCEEADLIELSVGNNFDVVEIIKSLLSGNAPLSPADKEDIKWFLTDTFMQGCIGEGMPDEIPFKENMTFVLGILIQTNKRNAGLFIKKYAKTATDILRLLATLSGADTTLTDEVRFRNFSRPERKVFLRVLNEYTNVAEDMKRHKTLWIRLGEKLHPGDYSKQFPIIYRQFSKLRSGERIVTFNSKVQEAIEKREYKEALALLKDRPGEFARRLDEMLSKAEDKMQVLNEFKKVAAGVSSRVLLQVVAHFKDRQEERYVRLFFPKGGATNPYLVKNEQSDIDELISKMIVQFCENALINEYSQQDLLGKVYIAPELRNYKAPMNQRSASKALRTVGKGSRLPLNENASTIRGFIWWTNNDDGDKCDAWNSNRVDLDLSAVYYTEDWKYLTHVSYTRLKSDKAKAYHSGDITNGGSANGEGVSEFLDVDIEAALKFGARYIVYSVLSYTGQSFSTLKNCKFGWMEREYPGSGEIYDPRMVKQCMDLTSNSQTVVPMIFDLQTRECIWADEAHGALGKVTKVNAVETMLDSFGVLGKTLAESNTCDLYTLAQLHTQARGFLVDTPDKADLILNEDKAYETDFWQAMI